MRNENRFPVKFTAPDANVLIVDDAALHLKTAKDLLTPYEIRVDLCENGYEAIDNVRSKSYDMIFMDYLMPEMNGIETTKYIRRMGGNRIYSSLPIIALTADDSKGAKKNFLESEFNDYLTKPIGVLKLNEMLIKWLPAEKHVLKEGVAKPAEIVIEKKSAEFEIEGLEVHRGIMNSGGKTEYFVETLSAFLSDGFAKLKTMDECLENNDWEKYCVYAGAFKSSLNIIGAVGLHESAKLLVNASKNEDARCIDINHDNFMREMESLFDSIKNFLDQRSKSKYRDQDIFRASKIKYELKKLKAALAESDMTNILETFFNVQCMIQTEEDRELIEEISKCILFTNYNRVESCIGSLLKKPETAE